MDGGSLTPNGHLPQRAADSAVFGDLAGRLSGSSVITASSAKNDFRKFWDLGFMQPLPIIPPGAPVSERSSIAKRMKARPEDDPRGKVPGVRWTDGSWSSYDWSARETTEDDLDRWAAMGAAVGIKTGPQPDGTWLFLIDADALDEQNAATIREHVEATCGKLPIRIGRHPKAGYLVRTRDPVEYLMLGFGPLTETNKRRDRIEILGAAKQFVAAGIHPKTMRPYSWPGGVPAFADVPIVDPSALRTLLEGLAKALPNASTVQREGAGADVKQETLRGNPEWVKAAVRALPNTSELFPDREDWRNIGYAVKAALADDPGEAFELFSDWSDRWEDEPGGNTPEANAALWGSLKPPFRRGASWLYELAEAHGGGSFSRAVMWTAVDTGTPEPIFQLESQSAAIENSAPRLKPITRRPDPRAIPTRRWLIEPRYGIGTATVAVGEPGVNKSTLGLQDALAVATGDERLIRGTIVTPDRLHRTGPVIVYNGEDDEAEMERRITAAMTFHSIEETTHPIHLWSGVKDPLWLMTRTGPASAAPQRAAGAALLERRIRETGAVFVVLDPLKSLSRGLVENSTDDMDVLVQEAQGIAARCSVGMLIIHHTAKNTREKAGDMAASRGAFSIPAKARGVFTLCHVQPEDAEDWSVECAGLLRLDYAKVSYGAKPNIPTLLRVHGAPVGNGAGFGNIAEEMFNGSPAEHLERRGDFAPVIEVVGLGIDRDARAAASRINKNANFAGVVDTIVSAMGDRATVRLSAAWPELGAALNAGRHTRSATRQQITETIKLAIGGGREVQRPDGQTVRVRCFRDGPHANSPWLIVLENGFDKMSAAGAASAASEGAFA